MISSSNSNTAFLNWGNKALPSGKSPLCQIFSLITVKDPDEMEFPGNDDAINVFFLVARILPDEPAGLLITRDLASDVAGH